jgi:hypothetical protein
MARFDRSANDGQPERYERLPVLSCDEPLRAVQQVDRILQHVFGWDRMSTIESGLEAVQ